MWWFLIWTVLVLAALALQVWLALRVVRKGRALLAAVGQVGEQLAEVSDSARRAFDARLAATDAEAAADDTRGTGDVRDPLTSGAGLR